MFLTDELYAAPGEPPEPVVHAGHHHGLAGALLVLSALVLSRPGLVGARIGRAYAAMLGLMLAYGLANLANDLWHEQVLKRGWSSYDLPSALEPRVHAVWVVVLAGAASLYVLGFARGDGGVERGDTLRR